MSASPMPQGGADRQIFIIGLRRMSDQCEAPTLTPECPFFELTPQGPACAEQCMDLLAEHGADDSGRASQTLGPDLAAIRQAAPRPRRAPDPDVRPFDAARVRLRDHDRPTEQKSTTSLMRDLRDHLTTPPTFSPDVRERSYVLRASVDELVGRGLDAELVVRCGLSRTVELTLGFAVVSPEVAAANDLDQSSEHGLPEPDPTWRALFDEARRLDRATDADPLKYLLTGHFGRRVRNWMATAPLDEVLNWTAPSRDAFISAPTKNWSLEETAQAAWLVDRFTETYLEAWRRDALAMEWSYLHGQQVGCGAPAAMRERPTDADEVARAIADKSVKAWRERTNTGPERSFSPQDFTYAAVENLAAGRLDAAAAIFAAVVRLSPDSPEANNNYGFCILPTDVKKALEHLERAAELGPLGHIDLTNSANRVLALHLLGRDEAALKLASDALSLRATGSPSFLWLHGPGALRVTDAVDPHRHLEQLRDHLVADVRWDSCRMHPVPE